MKDMPKPTDAHRKLEKLVGTWTGEEKLSPSPWDPQGGMAKGRVTNRLAIDGFAVIQDYEQERNGKICFYGHGVFRFDAMTNCYESFWFDSMGMPVNHFRGNFDGDVLSMSYQSPMGHTRCTFDLRERGRYVFRMEVSQDGQSWYQFMEGSYAKKG